MAEPPFVSYPKISNAPTSPLKRKRMKDRQTLAALNFCREYLYFNGFITEAENTKIHSRIMKFQDRKRIGITEAQLMSVELKYDNNAQIKNNGD